LMQSQRAHPRRVRRSGRIDGSTSPFEEATMKIPQALYNTITAKYGSVIDLKRNPEILQKIFEEIATVAPPGASEPHGAGGSPPFGISWMDSWVAHWTVNDKILTAKARDEEFAAVLKGLIDLKFNERLAELKRFIRQYP